MQGSYRHTTLRKFDGLLGHATKGALLLGNTLLWSCSPTIETDNDRPQEAPKCQGPDYSPPALPIGVPPSLYADSLSLFTPPPPDGDVQKLAVQRGVQAGTISPERIARLFGQVMDRQGNAMPCVRVSVEGHPELGFTLSRSEGRFDLAVNAGAYTLRYELTGYLPVQRTTTAAAHGYSEVPDVVMTALGDKPTPISMGSAEVQVARGPVESDEAGLRQATLLFMPGTRASVRLRNGTQTEVSTLNVRAVEYTVGPRGAAAMPGPLPRTSAYTYAVELLADEVMTTPNAAGVEFDRPVYVYLQSFLPFPVGSVVPAGAYDSETAKWEPSDNGRVVQILSFVNGKAVLDVTGTGKPASPDSVRQLGLSDEELSKLESLGYKPGQTLWRIPVRHFTPWDFNWPYGPPPDAVEPPLAKPTALEDLIHGVCAENPGQGTVMFDAYTIIDCDKQVLRYQAPIDGAGGRLALVYANNRVPEFTEGATLLAPLTIQAPPSSLREIRLELLVAGRHLTADLMKGPPYPPNWTYPFQWDGLDWQKKKVMGPVTAVAAVSYIYDPYYFSTKEDWEKQFGRFPSQVYLDRIPAGARTQISLKRLYNGIVLHARHAENIKQLGGFTLSAFHSYHPDLGRVYLGDGRVLDKDVKILKALAIERYAGLPGQPGSADGAVNVAQFKAPTGIAISNNGDSQYAGLLVADSGNCILRRVTGSDVSRFAGRLPAADCANVNPENERDRLTAANLGAPSAVAFGGDQNLYFVSPMQGVVQAVNLSSASLIPDYVYNVAGNGSAGGGDNREAVSVGIGEARAIAVGTSLDRKTLTLYVTGHRLTGAGKRYPVVQRVDVEVPQPMRRNSPWAARVPAAPADIVLAGSEGSNFTALALADHSSDAQPSHVLYVADAGSSRSQVQRLKITLAAAPTASRIAGTGNADGWDPDSANATTVRLNQPEGLALSPDNKVLYIADTRNHLVRRLADPEGNNPSAIDTVAGVSMPGSGGVSGPGCSDRTFANRVGLGEPVGLAATQSTIYVSDRLNHTICAITPLDGSDPNTSNSLIIPHDDQENKVTRFYYFTRTYLPNKGEYPGIHLYTKVAALGETDPLKSTLEYQFTVDPATQLPTSVEDKMGGHRFTINYGLPGDSAVIDIGEMNSGAHTNATRTGNYLTSLEGKTSGSKWAFTFPGGGKGSGLLSGVKLTQPTMTVDHQFEFAAGGRLTKVAQGAKTVNLAGTIR